LDLSLILKAAALPEASTKPYLSAKLKELCPKLGKTSPS